MNHSKNQTTKNYDDYHKVKSIDVFKNGYTFQFIDGNTVIECWGSCVTGKEKIKLDGKLISEKRNMTSRKSLHSINHEGINYEVEFNVISMLTGELHCILIKDGVHFETKKLIVTKGRNNEPYSKKKFWRDFFVSTGIGFIFGFVGMSIYLHDDLRPLIDGLINTIGSWF